MFVRGGEEGKKREMERLTEEGRRQKGGGAGMQGKDEATKTERLNVFGETWDSHLPEESQKAKADHQDESVLLNSLGSALILRLGRKHRNTAKRSGFEFRLK